MFFLECFLWNSEELNERKSRERSFMNATPGQNDSKEPSDIVTSEFELQSSYAIIFTFKLVLFKKV